MSSRRCWPGSPAGCGRAGGCWPRPGTGPGRAPRTAGWAAASRCGGATPTRPPTGPGSGRPAWRWPTRRSSPKATAVTRCSGPGGRERRSRRGPGPWEDAARSGQRRRRRHARCAARAPADGAGPGRGGAGRVLGGRGAAGHGECAHVRQLLRPRGDPGPGRGDGPVPQPGPDAAQRRGRGQGMAATMVVGDVSYYPGQETAGPELVPVERASGVTRRVPEDHRTISAAVAAARPRDLVLIRPGVYREEGKVAVPSLTIRGRDRNRVVVDGEFQR